MSHSLFGTDGIRALAGKHPLTPAFVEKIGFAAGKVLKSKAGRGKGPAKVVVGSDTRESCSWIESALSKGLARAGVEAWSCGVIPTSAVSAILHLQPFIGGTVISASHNPPEFNGVKFFSSNGKKIPDAWEREIEKLLSSLKSLPAASRDPEPRRLAEAAGLYISFLRQSLSPDFSLKGFRWVVDCANGASSGIAPAVLRSFGAEVHAIHFRPDGKNINLKCGALHTESLQKEILKRKAHGGCAFDGDADRVQFVDERGQLLDGDVLIGLAAQHLKEMGELKKNTVVTTVMANLGFMQAMKRMKINVITTQVGDRAVSEALESSGAVVGGEQSGHIIFRKHLPTGDGLLTALKILELVVHHGKKLSHYAKAFPKTPQFLLNLRVEQKTPVNELPPLKKAIEDAERKMGENGRILVRYSGTEPLLRIMVEARTLAEAKAVAGRIADVAKNFLQ